MGGGCARKHGRFPEIDPRNLTLVLVSSQILLSCPSIYLSPFLSISLFLCLSRLRGLLTGVDLFWQGLGKDEHDVCAERVGVWGGKDVAQAPAGQRHNKHFGKDEVSVQRVGVWHNSWAHYPTVVTPNDRRHKYANGERFNHGIH